MEEKVKETNQYAIQQETSVRHIEKYIQTGFLRRCQNPFNQKLHPYLVVIPKFTNIWQTRQRYFCVQNQSTLLVVAGNSDLSIQHPFEILLI